MFGFGTARMNSAQPSRVLVKSCGVRFSGVPLAIQDETSQACADRFASSAAISIVCPCPDRRRSRSAVRADRAAWTPACSSD